MFVKNVIKLMIFIACPQKNTDPLRTRFPNQLGCDCTSRVFL